MHLSYWTASNFGRNSLKCATVLWNCFNQIHTKRKYRTVSKIRGKIKILDCFGNLLIIFQRNLLLTSVGFFVYFFALLRRFVYHSDHHDQSKSARMLWLRLIFGTNREHLLFLRASLQTLRYNKSSLVLFLGTPNWNIYRFEANDEKECYYQKLLF